MGRIAPFSGPLSLNICIHWPTPQSISPVQRRRISERELPTKRPDLDNIVKLYLDAMQGLVFEDDSQIVGLYCTQRYTPTPGYVDVEVYQHEAIDLTQTLDGK